MLSVSDNKKIGILLAGLGLLFLFLGVLLLFDSGLLAIGNILFICSFPFLIGFRGTVQLFFNRRERWRGVAAFFGGVLLVLLKWPVMGMIIELFGIVEMFGRFLPYIVQFLRQIPYLGQLLDAPGVNRFVDWIAGASRPARPPV